MPVPYVVYADFESIIKPKTATAGDKSEITSEHEACGLVIRLYDTMVKPPNLKLKIKPGKTKIPVIFHNLKGYDSHLIMQKIHTANGNITCIQTMQKNIFHSALDNSSF